MARLRVAAKNIVLKIICSRTFPGAKWAGGMMRRADMHPTIPDVAAAVGTVATRSTTSYHIDHRYLASIEHF